MHHAVGAARATISNRRRSIVRTKLMLGAVSTLVALVSVVFVVPTPAAAASLYVVQAGTDECLAADYRAIYTFDCTNVNYAQQYWQINAVADYTITLAANIGDAGNHCLSNFDYNRVWTTTCDGTDPGIYWHQESDSRLKNLHTGRYLVADYSHRVYLSPTAPGQTWDLRSPYDFPPYS
jgi:hypothetical protein